MTMMVDRGPMAPTNEKLDAVLLELFQLNLTLRDVLSQERQAPVVNVTGQELDLSSLTAVLNQPAQPMDLSALEACLTALVAPQRVEYGPDIIGALRGLQKEFTDLGTGMRAIAGAPTGGGGAVYLTKGSTIDVTDNPNRSLGLTYDAAKDQRYEFQTLGGSVSYPLYVGSADPGAVSTNQVWRVEKYTYATGPAGDPVPTVVQTLNNVRWSDRASLFSPPT